MLTNSNVTKSGPSIKYGFPEWVFLDSDKEKCLNGTMFTSEDQFLISFSQNN